MLFIDAHEFGYSDYLFPPHADPEYHETPDTVHDWIFDDYSPAIVDEFEREKLNYHHGAPYDFFATIFGDTVPGVGFHAAGMTFEKDNRDRDRRPHVPAVPRHVGVGLPRGDGRLATACGSGTSPTSTRTSEGARAASSSRTPSTTRRTRSSKRCRTQRVRHYFLPTDPSRAYELEHARPSPAAHGRRRVPADGAAARSTTSTPYGEPDTDRRRCRSGRTGSRWRRDRSTGSRRCSHEETYIPYEVTYDVTSWSNPLLLNLQGGWTGDVADSQRRARRPRHRRRRWDGRADPPRVGLFEIPELLPRLRVGRPDALRLRADVGPAVPRR